MLSVSIHSSSLVSPELRERVRDAIRRVGCVPIDSGAGGATIAILSPGEQEPNRSNTPTLFCRTTDPLEENVIRFLTQLTASEALEVHGIPKAPALYANPPYALTYHFVGREQELRDLDNWAASGDPAMVYEAIGGMGKSALAWEWLQTHSEKQLPNLAGRMWWSFYERGSSMRGFVRHALAYVTGEPEENFRNADDWEVTHTLIARLRERPFLLVLDGFERILAAYHHLEKAQIRDDKVREDLCQCTNPLDGDLIRSLIDCAPSRILVTSRLMPKALEGKVVHHALQGLTPRDAESLVRAAGVKGTSNKVQEFASAFGCHALVVRVVCGMVNAYPEHPSFFDKWIEDPNAGGALKLDEIEPGARHTHVLQFALANLDLKQRQLLSRIAVLSDTAAYETIRVVSPYESAVELHNELNTLGERGLLQWDQHANTYDLHPAVRGVAFDQLDQTDRAGTYKALRDHFAAMPPEDYKRATELAHLKNSIEVFRLLLGAGLLKEAASHYFGELASSLMYSVGAYTVVVELLTELRKAAGSEPAKVLGARPASYVLGALSIALAQTGEFEAAREMEAETIALDLAEKDWANLSIEIRNLSLGRSLAARTRGIQLSLALANKAGNTSGAAIAYLSLAHAEASRGNYDAARKMIQKFRGYPTPGRPVYQRGDVELLEASIQLEEGSLTTRTLEEGESLVRQANNLAGQKEFAILRARFELEHANGAAALAAADAAIEIIRRTGERAPLPFALRALALARLSRVNEARESLGHATNNIYSARACQELGYEEPARACLLKAYTAAWDDGPPYCYQWELNRCADMLRELRMDVPDLPQFDESRVQKFPHEDRIRAALT
jgi:hypothetical protein